MFEVHELNFPFVYSKIIHIKFIHVKTKQKFIYFC